MEAHGYNHNLQVYKHAVLHPSQGNISCVPMNSRELHGLVDGGHHRSKELHGESDSPFCLAIFHGSRTLHKHTHAAEGHPRVYHAASSEKTVPLTQS